MTAAEQEFRVGDECIYRLRESSSSERVRIVGIHWKKRAYRVDLLFLDGPTPDEVVVNLPGGRLRGYWATVAEYDELMAKWDHISEHYLDDIETSAVCKVFKLLIPKDIAAWHWRPVHFATEVLDVDRLNALTGGQAGAIIESVASFEHNGSWWLSPDGTLRIAEAAAYQQPTSILNSVSARETGLREKCKRGSPASMQEKAREPELEYELYLMHDRPLHELLRQWCRHRAVTMQGRLDAAEAEVARLDILVAELVDDLAKYEEDNAKILEERHESERVTPYNVRPVVERPPNPWEAQTIIVYRTPWWSR